MRGKKFRFHPAAREEFRAAVRYRERNVLASVEFRKATSSAVREIAEAPTRWPKHLYGTRRFLLHRFPFSVVYLNDGML